MAVVTISRKFGAGGKTLGEMIAEKLGYTLFDNELIQLVAEQAKVSEKGVDQIEKESSGKFRHFIRGLIPKSLPGMVPKAVEETRSDKAPEGVLNEEVYVDVLQKIITKIAEGDQAVIIGRAGQYILKDAPNAFHVLATADRDDRIQFLVDKYSLSPREAMKAVELDDKRRSNLFRKFGKDDYDQSLTYHLVLNTSKTTLHAGCEIICELIKS